MLHETSEEIRREAGLPIRCKARQIGLRGDHPLENLARQQRDVRATLLKRWGVYPQLQARHKIGLEFLRRSVGRRDKPDVDLSGRGISEALILSAIIEHPQEMSLNLAGKLTELVQEQGAAICAPDQARTMRHAGVGVVLDVPEQLSIR